MLGLASAARQSLGPRRYFPVPLCGRLGKPLPALALSTLAVVTETAEGLG